MTLPSSIESETSSQVDLTFGAPLRQNRATVFFRYFLVIPQWFVLYFVGLAAFVMLVIGWFAALFTGRLPRGIADFLRGYLRWSTRVSAYLYLMTDKYPPFSLEPSTDFPVDLDVRTGRLNRSAVFFRYFLVIPAGIAAFFLGFGMLVFGVVNWIATLIKGEQPRMFFQAYAAGLRYLTRLNGYFYMLTSFYPSKLMGDGETPNRNSEPRPETPEPTSLNVETPEVGLPEAPEPSLPPASTSGAVSAMAHGDDGSSLTSPVVDGTAPDRKWTLVLSAGARKLVVAFLVLGVVGSIGYGVAVAALISTSVSSSQAITAENQAADAYNTMAIASKSYGTATGACSQLRAGDAAIISCLESNDAKFAAALNTFANDLSTINFPSSVSAEVSAAQTAAAKASTTMKDLSNAGPDAQSYSPAVSGANLQSVFSAVHSTFNRLNSALMSL